MAFSALTTFASQYAGIAGPVPGGNPLITTGLKLLLTEPTGGVIFKAASTAVGTVYPVYASAKAIESKDKADDVQWLTYWAIYGAVALGEFAVDKALSNIPYYYHAKFLALLWLQLPQTQGAAQIYQKLYKPALDRFGPKVDAVLAKGQSVLLALYQTYRVPVDAAIALLVELQKQAGAAAAWFVSDARKDAEKPKAA